ncbi:MAG: hypothetical protein WAV15_02730 [Minisyncoccia bacterium]
MKKKFVGFVLVIFVLYILLALPCRGNLICTGLSITYFEHLLLWIVVLLPLSLLALTLSDQKHKFWLKLSGIFFVISISIVFLVPEYDSGIVSVDRELTNWFFVGLYSLVSIIYFIVAKRTNKVIT